MPYTFRAGDLPKLDLDVDKGDDFKAWKTEWDSYRDLSGLADEAPAKQVKALGLCFSRDTAHIVENLGLTVAQRGDQA